MADKFFWDDWSEEERKAFFRSSSPEAYRAAWRAQGIDLKCTDEQTLARAAAIITADDDRLPGPAVLRATGSSAA